MRSEDVAQMWRRFLLAQRLNRRHLLELGVANTLGTVLGGCGQGTKRRSIPAATAAATARPATGIPYEIGFLSALTGPGTVPSTYIALMWGVRAFVQDLNARGGIAGHLIHLTIEDDQASPPTAIAGFTKLVDQDKVLAVLGLSLSNTVDALMPKIAEAQVPVVYGPSAPLDSIQPPQKWMFALGEVWAPLNDLAFQYILSKTGGKFPKIVVVTLDTAAGKEAADAATTFAIAHGGRIAAVVTIPATTVDFSPFIDRIVAEQPEWVLGNPYTIATPSATRQLLSRLPNAKILAATGLQDSNLIRSYNSTNYYFIRPFAAPTESDSPSIQRIVSAGKAAGAPNDALTNVYYTEGWVMGLLIAKALQACGENCTRASLRDAIEAIGSLDTSGLSGPIGFSVTNHWGNPNGRIWHYNPANDRFEPLSDWLRLSSATR